jgi:hypothetical protein
MPDQTRRKWVKGVITGVPEMVNMQEIKDHLMGGSLIEVKCLQMTQDGKKVDSLSVLLHFEYPVLPENVGLGL